MKKLLLFCFLVIVAEAWFISKLVPIAGSAYDDGYFAGAAESQIGACDFGDKI